MALGGDDPRMRGRRAWKQVRATVKVRTNHEGRNVRQFAPTQAPAQPARRSFLIGAAATGFVLGRVPPAAAQAPVAKTRIDVHHHFLPQFHVDAMMAPGRRAAGSPPRWSPASSLEEMDKSG